MRLNSRTQVWTTRVCLTGLVLFIILVMLYLCVCTEAPFAPVDVEPKDYSVYFFEPSDSMQLFVYHPTTGKIETEWLEWQTNMDWGQSVSPTVSHDGSLLYMPVRPEIYVYDTQTMNLVTMLEYETWFPIDVSANGKYIAFYRHGLFILNTDDYSIIYSDTTSDNCFSFSSSGNACYYFSYETGTEGTIKIIKRVELDDSSYSVTSTLWEFGYPKQIIPSPNEDFWLVYSALGMWVDGFLVYDVALDSIIFDYLHSPGGGKLAMTPDGRYAFFGNPGGHLGGPVPRSGFNIFDIHKNEIEQFVVTDYFVDSLTPYAMGVGPMVVTPDNHWLIGLEGPTGDCMFLYDIEAREFRDYEGFGDLSKDVRKITVQLIP